MLDTELIDMGASVPPAPLGFTPAGLVPLAACAFRQG
jgi:hypothetical protein